MLLLKFDIMDIEIGKETLSVKKFSSYIYLATDTHALMFILLHTLSCSDIYLATDTVML